MNKFEIRTEKKKKDIIQASLELFAKKGYSNVSIKEIASVAKVSQVSIYNYFESKEGVVGKCVEELMKETFQKARAILAENLSFKEKLTKAIALCNTEVAHSMNTFFSDNALLDNNLINLVIYNVNLQKNELYRDYIEHGIDSNEINPHLSGETILELLDVINTVGGRSQTSDYEKKSQELMIILFGGILTTS